MWSNVQSTSESPSPSSRSKYAVCVSTCSTNSGCIYLLGGRSANLPLKDFWKFDPVQQTWEEIRTRGCRPPCLQEHTMVSWKNSLYVFGGEIGFASTGETPLWILDLVTLTWRKHHVQGTSSHQPAGRRGHSAVVYDGAMHVYGGYQDLRGSSSELWTFDFASERWSMMLVASNLEQPPPRHNHSCVVYDGGMWIYGGLTDLQPKGDFWKWDFEIQEWFRIKIQRGPGELFGHAAVKVFSHMYLFGGERVGNSTNELWRYHFATECWERVAAEGAQPPPKCRHVAIANPSIDNETTMTTKECWNDISHQNGVHHDSARGGKPLPPKSLSMCFGQQPKQEVNGSRKRTFKFRVHPVSRLCSKNTSSDEEDDDEYTVGYNHNAGQVNLRYLKDRISSSRLVRSISSGSYSILHNQSASACKYDEMERLMEAKTNPQHQQQPQRPRLTIQKSQSSDAVLESDIDNSAAKHRPRSEVLTEPTTGVPIWVENPNASLSPTSWSDGHQLYSHHFSHRPGSTTGNGCLTPATRPSRLAYDGPLSTVKDVEEENSENADEATMVEEASASNKNSFSSESDRRNSVATEMLVDLDIPEADQERARYPSRFASSYTMSDLTSQTTTPSIESRGMPHSVSHSSGYHSFTDEEGGFEFHREFAGCLNTANARKMMQKSRDLELKTFTPTHQLQTPTESAKVSILPSPQCKERARSWDRSYQRKQVHSYPCAGGSITPTYFGTSEETACEKTITQVEPNDISPPPNVERRQSRSRHWSRSPAKPRPDQHTWNLCLYLFGGPEQRVPGVYRQPISIWKLYV